MKKANERIAQIQGILAATVEIGNAKLVVHSNSLQELVPMVNDLYTDSPEFVAHLRWMIQKGNLGQDMFLTGIPGPMRRLLALRYAQLSNQEVEYVAISRDLSDSDLKQRREITNSTAIYSDQPCVRAAIHGRILILDGIEKAERNVLPVLNNLLENREMALEDGRFLVSPTRYDMQQQDAKNMKKQAANKLVRVSEKFLVIALALPVPKYEGFPLDPPFRSRFQARLVEVAAYQSQLNLLCSFNPKAPINVLKRLISVGLVFNHPDFENPRLIPEFPTSLDALARILNCFPEINMLFAIEFCYPYAWLPTTNERAVSVIESTLLRFHLFDRLSEVSIRYEIGYAYCGCENTKKLDRFKTARFKTKNGNNHLVKIAGGAKNPSNLTSFISTPYHSYLLTKMSMAHSSGDICIIGEKGAGKSILVRAFAASLGYDIKYIPVYKDMTARSLLQRRSTSSNGDTVWEISGLVEAAINGQVAILDPIEVLSFGTLASIQRLVYERELPLPDGSQLINPERYAMLIKKHGFTAKIFEEKRIFAVHPCFRIIAIARPSSSLSLKGTWLGPELLSMFSFIVMRPMNYLEELEVIESVVPNFPTIKTLLLFANQLRNEKNETLKILAANLSTRQLIRIAKHMRRFPETALFDSILKASLYMFLPAITKKVLEDYLNNFGILRDPNEISRRQQPLHCRIKDNAFCIGNVACPLVECSNPLMIPHITFYENQRQTVILQEILKDYILGEHLFLVGNQGVGKNKIIDYFLQQMQLPREYIQLHRDTTVHSLTSNPTVVNGLLVYEDSPLVKAIREGYVLVVDEADKAPTHVTSILKSLVEDGEMVLSDGRRIVTRSSEVIESSKDVIFIHPQFLMVVLANRPGFPFLGNDFYREIGDVFACHCIDNPDPASELKLLKQYAPDVSEELLLRTIAAFNDLRQCVVEGTLTYPYSTRELVNAVKHLQMFPSEGLASALDNVFDFDSHVPEIKKLLVETMNKNGIPTANKSSFEVKLAADFEIPLISALETWTTDSRISRFLPTAKALVFRGSWPISVAPVIKKVTINNARSNVFTELLYTFVLDAKAEYHSMDAILGSCGNLYVVGIDPVNLIIVSPDHLHIQTIDLYEYIPSNRNTKLSLAEVCVNTICIHNSQENNFLLVSTLDHTVSVAQIEGLDLAKASILVPSSFGFLLFYQKSCPNITLIDIRLHKQFLFSFLFAVEEIYIIDKFSWFITDDLKKKYKIALNFTDSELSLDVQQITAEPPLVELLLMGTSNNASNLIHICSPNSFGGFFEHSSPNQSYINAWVKAPDDACVNRTIDLATACGYLYQTNQIVSVIPSNKINFCWIELTNCTKNVARRIGVNLNFPRASTSKNNEICKIIELQNGNMLLMDSFGKMHVYQTRINETLAQLKDWKRLAGGLDPAGLKIVYSGEHPNIEKPLSNLTSPNSENEEENTGSKKGSGDELGEGEGGFGGSGGMGTSGNAQAREEGRQSGSVDESFQLRTASDIAPAVTEAQKQLHDELMMSKLKDLRMSMKDMEQFQKYKLNVDREIRELRVVLEAVESKNKERIWLTNKTAGDIDDTKLVEGLAGDRAIYRSRGENEDNYFQQKPKTIYFVFDLSASMMRFNGHDGRLDRSIECALMLMESLKGYEHKFQYKILGHSGDSPGIDFMPDGRYPRNEKEIFAILSKMLATASFCMSGDNTVLAVTTAIREIVNEEADDYLVLVLSDANLHQYNISTSTLSSALNNDSRVTAFMIFIGNLTDQAERLTSGLPGNAFICLNNKELPQIIRSMFAASMINK